MIQFDHFSSTGNITKMLVRLRIKLAHDRNKKHLIDLHSADPIHNYHSSKQSDTERFICSLFPPRKKWKQPSLKNRSKNGTPRNTSEKAMISLQLTIKYYREKEPGAPFLIKLDHFIGDI